MKIAIFQALVIALCAFFNSHCAPAPAEEPALANYPVTIELGPCSEQVVKAAERAKAAYENMVTARRDFCAADWPKPQILLATYREWQEELVAAAALWRSFSAPMLGACGKDKYFPYPIPGPVPVCIFEARNLEEQYFGVPVEAQ
jgi:hypothetical protein